MESRIYGYCYQLKMVQREAKDSSSRSREKISNAPLIFNNSTNPTKAPFDRNRLILCIGCSTLRIVSRWTFQLHKSIWNARAASVQGCHFLMQSIFLWFVFFLRFLRATCNLRLSHIAKWSVCGGYYLEFPLWSAHVVAWLTKTLSLSSPSSRWSIHVWFTASVSFLELLIIAVIRDRAESTCFC